MAGIRKGRGIPEYHRKAKLMGEILDKTEVDASVGGFVVSPFPPKMDGKEASLMLSGSVYG